MVIPGGRISWDLGIVALSYVVAFAVCLVACTTMEHMEVHFARQVAFSTIAALGVCSMHYTGAQIDLAFPRFPAHPVLTLRRYGRRDVLHLQPTRTARPSGLSRVPPRDNRRCGSVGVRHVEPSARAQRDHSAQQDGGDDTDETPTVADHGGEGGGGAGERAEAAVYQRREP